jgi:predicted Fe-Mo cluster-binding NifX family protein
MCDNSKECSSPKARAFSANGGSSRPLDDVPDATPQGPAPTSVRPGWVEAMPSERKIVAVPSELEGGLDAERSAHFGRAPGFAIVMLDGDYIVRDTFLVNRSESQGHGFAATALIEAGVTDVVTAGIGTGMYGRLIQGGVRVWREQDAPTVSSAIDTFVAGGAAPFEPGDIHAGGHTG